MATAQKPRVTLGGLAPLLDIDALEDTPAVPRGEEAPRMALDLIDEDPSQPRTEFDQVALQELADNIKASGGVKSPVSLRPHPTSPGRYMLNFGARRLRASRLAGLHDIPYFIDRKVDSFDQVAENEQREGLTPMELAMFVKARLDEGLSRAEIARRLGKSKPLITYACSLIDAPSWLMQCYRQGQCRGLLEIHDLLKLHEAHGDVVAQWCSDKEEITRTMVAALRRQLEASSTQASVKPFNAAGSDDAAERDTGSTKSGEQASVEVAVKPFNGAANDKSLLADSPEAAAKPAAAVRVLMGQYKGQPLVLDFSAEPPREGHVFGRRPGSARRLTVPAGEITLVGFTNE